MLGLAAALLYLVTLAGHVTADSLYYALAIESGDWRQMVDFFHLLHHPVGWLWLQGWQALGWTGRGLLPLQVLNAVAGGLCVALLATTARRITTHAWPALFAATGLAVSGGFWLLSVNAEFVTPALAAQLAVLLLIVNRSQQRPPTVASLFLLGAAIALAMGFYLTSAWLVVVALVDLALQPALSLRRRSLLAGALLLPLLLAACVVLIGLWLLWGETLWATLGAGLGSYGQWQISSLGHGVYGFLHSLALYPGLGMNDSTRTFLAVASWPARLLWGAYHLLLLLVALLPLLQTLRLRRRGVRLPQRTVMTLAVWSIGFVLFAIYWVPGDVSFWMPALAAWWLWVVLVLD